MNDYLKITVSPFLVAAVSESIDFTASLLPHTVAHATGMSGRRFRAFLNYLVGCIPSCVYLEIGTWRGATLRAAIHRNEGARGIAIDNWSEFAGPRAEFIASMAGYSNWQLIDGDFRTVDYAAVGPVNVFFYDGGHAEEDQYDGVILPQRALADQHVMIIDDWNWPYVREATYRALADLGSTIVHQIEVRTALDGEHPATSNEQSDWHNGCLIAVIQKGKHT